MSGYFYDFYRETYYTLGNKLFVIDDINANYLSLGSSLFWVVTQCWFGVVYRISGQRLCFTLEDGTHRLSRNVCKLEVMPTEAA
jgi:hypothetical protein